MGEFKEGDRVQLVISIKQLGWQKGRHQGERGTIRRVRTLPNGFLGPTATYDVAFDEDGVVEEVINGNVLLESVAPASGEAAR